MLAGTPSGNAYTFSGLERIFENAGFERSEPHKLPGTPQQLIISSK